jgi:transposase InsO family protein
LQVPPPTIHRLGAKGYNLFELTSQTYLILVDYYSKFPEICNLNKNLTTSNIIKNLKSIFARHGIPKILITDSGTQFNSSEIEQFANNWNFSIIPAAPKHQQCNGMVERTIQTIKRLMKKTLEKDEDLDLALLAYRNTPVLNSYTPSQLLMSRYKRQFINHR